MIEAQNFLPLFAFFRGSIKVALLTLFVGGINATNTAAVSAAPCYPNDPDSTNPGNLCLTYPPSWSPLPNSPVDQPPFIQGTGQPAYYGYPVSPTQPGRIIGTTNGYWTGVSAVNGVTTITDSNGNNYTAK